MGRRCRVLVSGVCWVRSFRQSRAWLGDKEAGVFGLVVQALFSACPLVRAALLTDGHSQQRATFRRRLGHRLTLNIQVDQVHRVWRRTCIVKRTGVKCLN